MRKHKKLWLIVLSLCLCMNVFSMNVFASNAGEIIDGSVLTQDKESSDTQVLMPDDGVVPYGAYLAKGTAYISDRGNGVVYVSGKTQCYENCNTVSVTIYLERLVNGAWQTVSSRSHTASNTNYTSYGISLAVQKGYYYRVVGSHSATKNGKTESTSTVTDGIYID